MTEPRGREEELEAYLAGDSALSRAYREASDELPPAHIDARILSEARRADAPVHAAPGPFSGPWMVPASLAVIVVAVSVVALLPVHEEVRLPPVPDADQRITRDREPGARSVRPAPAAGEGGGLRRDVAPEAARPDQEKSAATPAAPRPPEPSGRSGVTGGQGNFEDDVSRIQVVPEAPERRSFEALPSLEPKREREPPAAEMLRSLPDPEPAPDAAASKDGKEPELAVAPEARAWLERIARLIGNGELDTAAEELDAFRRRYPSVEIPPAILSAFDTGN